MLGNIRSDQLFQLLTILTGQESRDNNYAGAHKVLV